MSTHTTSVEKLSMYNAVLQMVSICTKLYKSYLGKQLYSFFCINYLGYDINFFIRTYELNFK